MVYCKDCYNYNVSAYGLSNWNECNSDKNVFSTWERPDARKLPSEINKNNDCSWFVLREEVFPERRQQPIRYSLLIKLRDDARGGFHAPYEPRPDKAIIGLYVFCLEWGQTMKGKNYKILPVSKVNKKIGRGVVCWKKRRKTVRH